MEDKDWFWQDDSYRLDAESPLAISRSLWDGLAQSEADSLSLFAATPTPDILDSNHYFASSVTDVESGGKGLHHHLHEPPREGSPRAKRRRMLLFPGSTTETSPIADPSFDSLLESTAYGSHLDGGFPGYEDYGRFEQSAPVSSNPLLYLKNDDPQFSIDEVLEPSSPKWLVRSFGDFQSGSEPYDPSKLLNLPKSELPASCADYQPRQPCELDVVDCPSTPYARCPTGRKPPPSTEFVRTRTPTPVAYPFALLKPCGAQGDVTLSDINQRISMPPSRPKPSSGGAGAGAGGLSETPRRLSPSGSPAMSPGGSPGISGKSVVALTKIHTEGNGSITIMRTRG